MSEDVKQQEQADEVFCSSCGETITKEIEVCPKCGVRQTTKSNWCIALLLCLFLGLFGAHRFYCKKIGTGLLMLLTLGGCGIWWLIDCIMILCGKFRDKSGRLLLKKDSKKEAAEKKAKSKGVTFVLWLFLGIIGAHKYYLGRTRIGILYSCTLGVCLIGWFLDIFTLFVQVDVCNGLRPKEDADIVAGIRNLLIFSRTVSAVTKVVGGGYTCRYCGYDVVPGVLGRCPSSPDGRHHE